MKQLEARPHRLAALKKMSSSNVYPDDLCFAPCWMKLYKALSLIILESMQSLEGPSSDMGVKEGRLALALVDRLADECLTSSPLHTAFLLSALQEPMMLGFSSASPHSPSSLPASDSYAQGKQSLLNQIEVDYPVGSTLAHLAYSLATSCSSDWHLLKSASQRQVAGSLCAALSATFNNNVQQGNFSFGIALMTIDPKMRWWRRMISCGGPGCTLVFQQAFESGLASRLLSYLSSTVHQEGSGSDDDLSIARMELACTCAVTLAGSPSTDSDLTNASWRIEAVMNLCCILCQPHRGEQRSDWMQLLIALASSNPDLFNGPPSQYLTTYLYNHPLFNGNSVGAISSELEPLSRLLEALSRSVTSVSPLISAEGGKPRIMNCLMKALEKLSQCSEDEPLAFSQGSFYTICCSLFRSVMRSVGECGSTEEMAALMAACELLASKNPSRGHNQALDYYLAGLALSSLDRGHSGALTSLEVCPCLAKLAAKRALTALAIESSDGLCTSVSVMGCSSTMQRMLIEQGNLASSPKP